MSPPLSLSPASRLLTYALAALYALLGAALFLFPDPLSAVFAWNVSPFIAMTIGGWCLGNAWAAFVAARRWTWAQVYPLLIYLWLFGVLELLVLLFFRDRLRLGHPIAWLYLVTLLVNLVAAVWGAMDWFRLRPPRELPGPEMTGLQRAMMIFFVVFVGFLGLYGLIAQIGWPATRGGVFPEEMSLFTLRSFGAFYLSLALAAVPLLSARSNSAFLNFAYGSYGLIFAITLAALLNLGAFDFAARPGGLAYIGVYVIVGVVALWQTLRHGTGGHP